MSWWQVLLSLLFIAIILGALIGAFIGALTVCNGTNKEQNL